MDPPAHDMTYLEELGNTFHPSLDLVKQGRTLLCQGPLVKKGKLFRHRKYAFFLFNDMVVWAKFDHRVDKFVMKKRMPVTKHFRVLEIPIHDDDLPPVSQPFTMEFAFRLQFNRKQGLTLFAADSQDRSEWLRNLRRCEPASFKRAKTASWFHHDQKSELSAIREDSTLSPDARRALLERRTACPKRPLLSLLNHLQIQRAEQHLKANAVPPNEPEESEHQGPTLKRQLSLTAVTSLLASKETRRRRKQLQALQSELAFEDDDNQDEPSVSFSCTSMPDPTPMTLPVLAPAYSVTSQRSLRPPDLPSQKQDAKTHDSSDEDDCNQGDDSSATRSLETVLSGPALAPVTNSPKPGTVQDTNPNKDVQSPEDSLEPEQGAHSPEDSLEPEQGAHSPEDSLEPEQGAQSPEELHSQHAEDGPPMEQDTRPAEVPTTTQPVKQVETVQQEQTQSSQETTSVAGSIPAEEVKLLGLMAEGEDMLKHHKFGSPKTRNVRCRDGVISWWDGTVRKGSIQLKDVTNVLVGRTFKGRIRRSTNAPEERCFSLVTRKRSLNLEAATVEQRDRWYYPCHLHACFDETTDECPVGCWPGSNSGPASTGRGSPSSPTIAVPLKLPHVMSKNIFLS